MNIDTASTFLWNKVVEKIENDWERDFENAFGTFQGIKELNGSFNFARALWSEMDKIYKAKKFDVEELVSVDTVHRALNRDGLTDKSQGKTMHSFARYVGFQDYEDFLKNSTPIVVEKELGSQYSAEANNERTEEVLVPKKNYKTHYLAFLLLCLSMYGYYWFSVASTLKHTIFEANNWEFNAYNKIPTLDTMPCSGFYLKSGQSYKEITERLAILRAVKVRLDSKSSTFSIQSMQVQYIGWDKATVETEEKWNIHWDGVFEKDTIVYNQTNVQTYSFQKEKGTWKILENRYAGKSVRK